MAELNGTITDRDLLVQLLTNQANIEKKIDGFGIAINDLHLRIDRVENRIETKFDSFYEHCRDQRNDCTGCIDSKLSSKIFCWVCGAVSPLLFGSGAWFVTKIFELNEKMAHTSAVIDGLLKATGLK